MNNRFKNHPFLTVAVLAITLIFVLLALLHFYWSFGGRLGYDEVLPTSSNGLRRLQPGRATGFGVAVGLLFFAFITAGNIGLFKNYVRKIYFRYGALAIAMVFFLRALGDFKFIGFFKTVRFTNFARNDTLIFSPLCLLIALTSLLIFILSKKSRC